MSQLQAVARSARDMESIAPSCLNSKASVFENPLNSNTPTARSPSWCWRRPPAPAAPRPRAPPPAPPTTPTRPRRGARRAPRSRRVPSATAARRSVRTPPQPRPRRPPVLARRRPGGAGGSGWPGCTRAWRPRAGRAWRARRRTLTPGAARRRGRKRGWRGAPRHRWVYVGAKGALSSRERRTRALWLSACIRRL